MSSPDRSTNDTAERLRQAGLRSTRPRMLVYQVLRDRPGHHSVDDLSHLLETQGHRVARMTVYNVIADLEAAGLIVRADAGPGRALYEVSDTWHHHFVCRVCRRVTDVPCVRGTKPCLMPPVDLGGTIEEAQVIFRGVCADCSRGSVGRRKS